MNHSLKKSLLASAVAAALLGGAAPALAINSILFDPNGGTPAGTVNINQFSWDQISVLANDAFNNSAGASSLTGASVLGQGRLQSYTVSGNGAVGNMNFTFVFSMDNLTSDKQGNGSGILTGSATLSSGLSAAPAATPTATNYFKMYANPVTDASLSTGDGCFSCGTLILAGSVFVDNSANSTNPAEQAGGTVLAAVLSGTSTSSIGGAGITQLAGKPIVTRTVLAGSGAVGMVVNVDSTTVDTTYFRSDISSFTIDIDFLAGIVDPFPSVNYMQKTIAGVAPDVDASGNASAVNDFRSGSDGAIRDMIFASNSGATNFFHAVPEPGSLALLGLGLAGLGAYARRRKSA